MAIVVLGADHPIGGNLVRLARNDGHEVVPVYHVRCAPRGADTPHVVADTAVAKEVAQAISPGDTVVLMLGGAVLDRLVDITDRLHATLAATVGRDVRLVVLDGFLPDVSTYALRLNAAARAMDVNLRQFFWAADLRQFAQQNDTSVTMLRSGPVYGAASFGLPFGFGFWRRILRGRFQWTIWSVDAPRFLCPVEEVSDALYKLVQLPPGQRGHVEELHLPGPMPVSIADLVSMGAQMAKTRARVRQMPRALRRSLAWVSDRWRNPEDLGIRSGGPDAALVEALWQRIKLRHAGHVVSIHNTIEALKTLG